MKAPKALAKRGENCCGEALGFFRLCHMHATGLA